MASNVMIQILEWSEDVILQGEDFDGVSFKTAEACLFGIVELSSAAVTATSEVPEIAEMSTAVCQNLAFYILSRLEGEDLKKFAFSEYKEQVSACLDSEASAQEKIMALISINVVRLFHIHPRSILAACFELLSARNENERKKGQNFLQQIMDGALRDRDKEPHCMLKTCDKQGNVAKDTDAVTCLGDESENIIDSLLTQVHHHSGNTLLCSS
jgi:activating signal cointegrator complex subunit 2